MAAQKKNEHQVYNGKNVTITRTDAPGFYTLKVDTSEQEKQASIQRILNLLRQRGKSEAEIAEARKIMNQ